MTRINTTAPSDLTNEWVLAETRELPRIVNELRDHPERLVLKDIPKQYTLGAGHCKFFRNKLLYLAKRHSLLLEECAKRGLSISKDIRVDLDSLPDHIKMFCLNDWTPSNADHRVLVLRLIERFSLRGKAYHMTKNNVKLRIDTDAEFNVYFNQHLAKYLGE